MKEKMVKHKTLMIAAAAIVVAAVGFAAGMMVKTSLAKNSGDYIGAERAKTIALESVGVSSAKATFTKVQIDQDDRKPVYDIEFFTTSNEYDFEIDAVSGEILEKKAEVSSHPSSQPSSSTATAPTQQQTQQSSSNPSAAVSDYIGVDRAKNIALEHGGVSAANAVFTKAKLDSDDGIRTYEIEFISGNTEYEYEINAYTGEIMDVSMEMIEDHHGNGYDD